MKKLVIFSFLVAVFASNVSAVVGMANKDVTGEWKYEVPSAPYGYEKGTLILEEKEGKLVGQIKFEDGYNIELKNVTYADSTLKCGLYVDYEYVSIKAKIAGKKLMGTVDTPEGEMKITASKIK